MADSQHSSSKAGSLLRRMDQLGVAVLLGIALVALAVNWFLAGGPRGEVIEIQRASPLHAQFAVDVNTAQWPELAQLPGIGETLARRIVESRAANGGFHTQADLRRVNGIGPLTLERLKPYLLPLPGDVNVAGQFPTPAGQSPASGIQ